MSEKYAVVILGAGSSVEYGLPTGVQLKTEIEKVFNFEFDGFFGSRPSKGDRVLFDALSTRDPRFPNDVTRTNELLKAGRDIQKALHQAPSIDQYIFNQTDQSDIAAVAKIAIARCIQIAEGKSSLFLEHSLDQEKTFKNLKLENTWMPQFFSLLIDGCSSLNDVAERCSRLIIISFNYDRCFKHYLFLALRNYFNTATEEDVSSAIQNIKFIHPYGSLGPLEWDGPNENSLSFGKGMSGEKLSEVALSIQTFNESVEADVVDLARDAMAKAHMITFLGFGFHTQNLDFLGAKNLNNAAVFATASGISEFDVNAIRRELTDRFGVTKSNINLFDGYCAKIFGQYSRAYKLIGF